MNGNAVVFASTVTADTTLTSGILFLGTTAGRFCGTSVTPTEDFTIPSGRTLTIPTGATLTIPDGVILTNNGTITPADGSAIEILGTRTGNKIVGANVSVPELDTKTTANVILNPSTILATTGQDIEYAYNTSNTAPTDDWQDEPDFTNLLPYTNYYFFARTKENENFRAGTPSSVSVTTDKAVLSGTVEIIGDAVFGQTLTASPTLTATPETENFGALSYQWKSDGEDVGTNSETYVLRGSDIGKEITVTVTTANCEGSVVSAPTDLIVRADGVFITINALDAAWTPGLKLADLTIPNGCVWDAPTTALSVGNGQTFAATYTDPSGNYTSATGTITVNVERGIGSGSVTIEDWNFGETPSVPVPVSETNGTTAVTYHYKVRGANDDTYIITVPVNVGNYTIRATFAATANYRQCTATADFAIGQAVSILIPNRKTPNVTDNNGAVIPQASMSAEFTVGSNPVSRSDGAIKIFASGKQFSSGTLTIYDATGNVVRKINIKDNKVNNDSRDNRVIGVWDLRDAKGNTVSTGSYLVRGTIKTVDGRRERVSAVVGVR